MPSANRDGKAVQPSRVSETAAPAEEESDDDESVRFVMRRPSQPQPAPTARVHELEESVLPRASMILDYIARTEAQQAVEADDSQRPSDLSSHRDSDYMSTGLMDSGELMKRIDEQMRLHHPEVAAQIDDRRFLVISDSPPPPRARPAAAPAAPRPAPATQPATPEVPAAQTPRPSGSSTRKTVASMFAAQSTRATPSPAFQPTVSDVPSTPVNPPTAASPSSVPVEAPVVTAVQSNVPSGQPVAAMVPPTRPAASEISVEQTVRSAAHSVPPVVSNQQISAPMHPQPTPTAAAPQRVHESPQPHMGARRELPAFRPAHTPVQPPPARLPNPSPSVPRIGSTWMTRGPRASGQPLSPMANGRDFGGHTPPVRHPFVHHHAEPHRFRQAPTSGPLFREERPFIPVRVPDDLRPPPPRYSREYAEDTHRTFDHFGGRPARRQPPPPLVRRPSPPADRGRRRFDVTADMFDTPEDRWSRGEARWSREDDRWSREAERARSSDFYRSSSPPFDAKVAAVQSMTAEELLQVMSKGQMCGIFSKLINIRTDALSDALAGNSRQSTSRATSRATETTRSERSWQETSTAPKGFACSQEVREVSVLADSDWSSGEEGPPPTPTPSPPLYLPVASPPLPYGGADGDANDSFRDRWSPPPAEHSPVPPPLPTGVYTHRHFETSDEEDEITEDEGPQRYGGNRATNSRTRRSPLAFINSSDEGEEE
ncbi:hypothetical protein M3Y99_00513400 [Aphelenchoides fujianensis]|nr:hypothetical protein M3Y99_00513400 [Aphelenchoides fujianensis]